MSKRNTIEKWIEDGCSLDVDLTRTLKRKDMKKEVFDQLHWVAAAASTDPARFILNSILVKNDGAKLISCDGRRLHIADVESDFDHNLKDGIWIITKMTKTELCLTPTTDGVYPNYEQVIPHPEDGLWQAGCFTWPEFEGHEANIIASIEIALDTNYLRDVVFTTGDIPFNDPFAVIWNSGKSRGLGSFGVPDPVIFKLPGGRTAVVMPIRPKYDAISVSAALKFG